MLKENQQGNALSNLKDNGFYDCRNSKKILEVVSVLLLFRPHITILGRGPGCPDVLFTYCKNGKVL